MRVRLIYLGVFLMRGREPYRDIFISHRGGQSQCGDARRAATAVNHYRVLLWHIRSPYRSSRLVRLVHPLRLVATGCDSAAKARARPVPAPLPAHRLKANGFMVNQG